MMKDTHESDDLRDQVKISNPEQLYQIKDEQGKILDFEQANGRQLFNHYRHNMTTYDQVLNELRTEQGHVTGRQEKKAVLGAAEQILEIYRDEHIKVIKDSQNKGNILKNLMAKVGVGTATALSNLLDSWSQKIKEIGHLESSQRSLQTWNDTYRVQRELVKKLLVNEGVQPEILEKVNAIYSTRSVNKAVERSSDLLNLEKSEILKLIKSAVRYAKLQREETL